MARDQTGQQSNFKFAQGVVNYRTTNSSVVSGANMLTAVFCQQAVAFSLSWECSAQLTEKLELK